MKMSIESHPCSVANGGLIDRERVDRHLIGVEAVNRGGAASSAASAEATISIRVLDANDQKPRFLKKKYEVHGDRISR